MGIKIAIPNKGRLQKPTLELLEQAGLGLESGNGRKLFAKSVQEDVEFLFMRAADIPEVVQDGIVDLGITGLDLIRENQSKVDVVQELGYGKCRLVLAVPEESKVRKPGQIPDSWKIATEFPNLTASYFRKSGKKVEVISVSGATEVAPYLGMADAITDLTSSGTTLKMNKLKVIDDILDSCAVLIANKDSNKSKKAEVEAIRSALISVIDARSKKYLMANVSEDKLENVKKIMPGLEGPTIMQVLGRQNMYAVHSVVEEKEIFDIIQKLKKAGAKDILITPIDRIIP